MTVLTGREIEQFVHRGFVKIHQAFPAEVAAVGRDLLWAQVPSTPDDRSTWPTGRFWITEVLDDQPFLDARRSTRVTDAFDQVAGPDRWFTPYDGLGWWPIRFPGGEPLPGELDWHVDGGGWMHHLHSPEQGLLPIFLFSTVVPGGGATQLAVGSHLAVARVLASAPDEGLPVDEIAPLAFEKEPSFEVVEAIGEPGDLYVCHPFLIHRATVNGSTDPRFIANPAYSLRTNLRHDGPDLSPVEQAIRLGLSAAS